MKIQKKEMKSIVATLKRIEESVFTSKNSEPTTIILVYTDVGTFSNFKSIWKRQDIDVEKLTEGDKLEIEYTEYEHPIKQKTYKNFYTIKVVSSWKDEFIDEHGFSKVSK